MNTKKRGSAVVFSGVLSLLLTAIVILFSRNLNSTGRLETTETYRVEKQRMRGPVKEPNDWFMLQRVYPGARIPVQAVHRAREQAAGLHNEPAELDQTWQLAGPSNVGGRITALAVDWENDIIYAGAAMGGAFKSVDGGSDFVSIWPDEFPQSVGALAIDPQDPNTLYLGSGEANSSGDSYPGDGIYVTRDGGLNWRHLGLEASAHIGKIAVDPEDPNNIYVAAAGLLFGTNPERGLYRSQDGGETWERSLFITDSTACIDVCLDPENPNTIYAVMWDRIRTPHRRQVSGPNSGIWRSEDYGATWERLVEGLPQGDNVGRGGITISPADPNRLYAFFVDHPGYLVGIYRSDDHGDSWTEVNYIDNLVSSFGWYFGQIHADPDNPNVVYVQGVNMFWSANGGTTWMQIFGDAHVDFHAMAIDPANPDHLITGHDGGINVSYDGGFNSEVFTYLPVSQFYAITHDHSQPQRLYGGTQDNSTLRTLDGEVGDWDVIYYGDGFYVQVDPRDSDVIYAEYQYGHISVSYNRGRRWTSLYDPFSNDRTNWNTPFQLDPSDPNKLCLGTYRVWKYDTISEEWETISPDLTDGPGDYNLIFGTITTLAFSPVDNDVIYAGTDDANLWVTQTGGGTDPDDWVSISDGLPDRWVTRVTPHPDSASVVYAAFSGYSANDQLPHLFRSEDFGENWISISGNLPEAPVNDVIVDPEQQATLYVGTDFGVFYSDNFGEEWHPLGNGLPEAAVSDLELIPETRTLIAGTHGRSMWKYQLGAPGRERYRIVVQDAALDGEQLAEGDAIRVYDHDQLLEQIVIADGFPAEIVTWEADPVNLLPGYTAGDTMEFRIFLPGENREVPALATYPEGLGDGTFGFGDSTVVVLEAISHRSLTIPLAGDYFEMVSMNLSPVNPDAEIVFGEIPHLSIVYQNDGGVLVFLQEQFINTIGEADPAQGYRIFCDSASQWETTGSPLPVTQEYQLQANHWNWIGYPFDYAADVEIALAEAAPALDILLNDDGDLWIPEMGIRTMDALLPGEGYLAFATDDLLFQYQQEGAARPAGMRRQQSGKDESLAIQRTGLPYAVLVHLTEELAAQNPSVVEIYDGDLLVGNAAIVDDHDLVPVICWQGSVEHDLPGFTSGHLMTVKVVSTDGSLLATTLHGKFGEGAYTDIMLDAVNLTMPGAFAVGNAYPNPFNPSVTVPFALPKAGEVGFAVFNLLGQQVAASTMNYNAGHHRFIFYATSGNLVSGVYFLQVQFNGQVSTQKIMLLR